VERERSVVDRGRVDRVCNGQVFSGLAREWYKELTRDSFKEFTKDRFTWVDKGLIYRTGLTNPNTQG